MAPDVRPAPVRNASVSEVRHLLDSARPDGLTLLDVRMEREYAAYHLPGARLLPLPELPDRLDSLDRQKPIIVYCRSGKRSAAAAALLAGAGFSQIVNMLGGVTAWQGAVASGPPDAGMRLLSGRESVREILMAALGMEAALETFYTALAQTSPAGQAVFERLAGFEKRHLQHILGVYRQRTGDTAPLADLLAGAGPELEGGRPGEDFLRQLGDDPASPEEALELAASVEAQAFDLYTRLARQAERPQQAELLTSLAQEEKRHLRTVASLMNTASSDHE